LFAVFFFFVVVVVVFLRFHRTNSLFSRSQIAHEFSPLLFHLRLLFLMPKIFIPIFFLFSRNNFPPPPPVVVAVVVVL